MGGRARFLVVAIVAWSMALVLGACGGGSADDVTVSSDDGAPAAQTSDDATASDAGAGDGSGEEGTTSPSPVVEPDPSASDRSFVSDDGVVRLEVPGGAADPGAEITVVASVDPDGIGSAYEFGPAGLDFDIPATLHWNAGPVPDGSTAFLLSAISEDGTVEALDDTTIEIVDGDVVVTAEVRHFSRFVLQELVLDVEQIRPAAPPAVDEVFTFELAIAGITALDPQAGESFEPRVMLTPIPDAPGQPLGEALTADWMTFACAPAGRFTTQAIAAISVQRSVVGQPTSWASASATVELSTECIDGPAYTEMALGPALFAGVPQLDATLRVANHDDTILLNVPAEAVPDGGNLALYLEHPDYFAECRFERRGFASGCTFYDNTAVPFGEVEIMEQVNPDGTISLPIPRDVFDIADDGSLLIGTNGMYFPVDSIGFDAFASDGSPTGSSVDVDEFTAIVVC